MFLDQPEEFTKIDPDGMLGHIDALPDQFENAWQHAQSLPLPESFQQVRQIVVSGMGGSAIGGDYLAALVAHASQIPVNVNRDYTLPAYVSGPEALVITSSNSGNTEETLSVFEEALASGAQVLAVTTGGKLAERAAETNVPLWTFSYNSQPRAAFGWSFGLLVGLAHRLKLAGDLSGDVQETLAVMRQWQPYFKASTPLAENPAKRLAGQFCGRIGVYYGGGILAPVARRWKCQVNENAKSWAEFDFLPEQNHNGVAALDYPEKALRELFCIFLQSDYDHPRVNLRQELSYQLYLQEAIGVDKVKARGESRLAQMMYTTLFGDYMSYYLAMENRVDPTPIPQISALKEGLAQAT